jgi:hypothetical protein
MCLPLTISDNPLEAKVAVVDIVWQPFDFLYHLVADARLNVMVTSALFPR